MNNQAAASKVPHRNPMLAKEELKTLLRRRAEHFRVLAAIAELFPRDVDINGQASGAVSVSEFAQRAGVSRKAVGRALKYWQQWRVLWVHWRREQIRFERTVVESVLAAWANGPRRVAALLHEHRAKRETAAPWPCVPKKPCVGAAQVAETALAEKAS